MTLFFKMIKFLHIVKIQIWSIKLLNRVILSNIKILKRN